MSTSCCSYVLLYVLLLYVLLQLRLALRLAALSPSHTYLANQHHVWFEEAVDHVPLRNEFRVVGEGAVDAVTNQKAPGLADVACRNRHGWLRQTVWKGCAASASLGQRLFSLRGGKTDQELLTPAFSLSVSSVSKYHVRVHVSASSSACNNKPAPAMLLVRTDHTDDNIPIDRYRSASGYIPIVFQFTCEFRV